MTQRERDYRAAHKYRQGRGWIVATWYDRMGAWDLSQELTYSAACQMVREERERVRNVH